MAYKGRFFPGNFTTGKKSAGLRPRESGKNTFTYLKKQ
jgi:hypothetical protein